MTHTKTAIKRNVQFYVVLHALINIIVIVIALLGNIRTERFRMLSIESILCFCILLIIIVGLFFVFCGLTVRNSR